MYVKELEIPEGVNVELAGNKVKVSGPKGQVEKEFKSMFGIKIERADNKLKASSESKRRKTRANVGTVMAHVLNMINGVTKGYTYKLKAVYSHFPVTIKVEGDKVLIHNFLGERNPRVAKIVSGVKVEVNDLEIIVSGPSVEDVGIVAGRIERATRIKSRDRKVFMDGIFLVSKE